MIREHQRVESDPGVALQNGRAPPRGRAICTITNPFKAEETTVEAPFTGVVVGVLENTVVYPGNPPLSQIIDPSRAVAD